jgi:hypothetical protein
MAKNTKKDMIDTTKDNNISSDTYNTDKISLSPNDLEWTDHVLSLLTDDEKISGNPTTDGLRRIFEIALNCIVIQATSDVVQSPEPNNEKRATVVHTISYVLKDLDPTLEEFKCRSISGSADVYWGNCDKIYRNHPVAVAETRAEGRALRRALKLRKVVAAEEIVENIEDHPDQNSVSKITNNQINFIDVIAKRLNISVTALLKSNNLESVNIYALSHEDAVKIIRLLSSYQQDMTNILPDITGYTTEWK